MKPEFPALDIAIKLVRDFFNFGLMRKFTSVMEGNKIINNEGLKELNERYQKAIDSVNNAEEEGLRISQQANDLTQQFYYERLKDFKQIASFSDYSPTFIEEMVIVYNLQHPQKQIDFEALVIYRMYIDNIVNDLNRLCNFYYQHYEKKFDRTPSVVLPTKEKIPSKRAEPGIAKKVSTELTANQLLYLFKVLKECGIFHRSVKQNAICRIIANSFSSTSYEELSADSLEKKWKNIDINDIAFWNEKFPELYNKSLRENPLRIKYKKKTDKDL